MSGVAWTRIFPLLMVCIGLSGCGSSKIDLDNQAWFEQLGPPEKPLPKTSRRTVPPKRSDNTLYNQIFQSNVAPQLKRGTGQLINQPSNNSLQFRPGRTVTGGDGIALNLRDVSVSEAAKAILGDILGLNYSVSEKVRGNVTLQTTRPVARAALIEIFETVLQAGGNHLVNKGAGHYRIEPWFGSAEQNLPVTGLGTRDRYGSQLTIVPLKYVAASQMEKILRPIAKKGGVLQADKTRNLLFLAGSPPDLKRMIDMVNVFDVDKMKGMSFALLPLRSSDPEKAAQELRTLFGVEDAPDSGLIRFVPNVRLNAVLVITSQPKYLDRAARWVRRTDQLAHRRQSRTFVIQLQNREAKDMAKILRRIVAQGERDDNGGKLPDAETAPKFTTATTSTGETDGSAAGPAGARGSAVTASSGGDDATAKQKEESSFPPGTKIVVDDTKNALVVLTTPEAFQRIRDIVARLDSTPRQVLVEAVIAEVVLNDNIEFGVRWFFQNKNSNKFRFSDAATGAVSSAFPGFSYFFSTQSIRVALNALSKVTKVNVVSAPSLTVLDNKSATLQVGDQVPIATQTSQGTTDANAPVINAIELKDTGVILKVKPRINDNGTIRLNIQQEVSSVVETTTSGIDSPTIQQRRIGTSVSVGDGEIVTLGGLIQERNNRTKTQVPILGNLPMVGSAFRFKNDDISRTELLIFIRPHVINNREDAYAVTDEFKSRMDFEGPASKRGRNSYERDFYRITR